MKGGLDRWQRWETGTHEKRLVTLILLMKKQDELCDPSAVDDLSL